MPILVLRRDNKVVGNYVIDKDIITIGRAHDNTISIANESVSRHHCRIEQIDNEYILTDLGSLNGTFVNDKQIKRGALSPGDTITISTYSLSFKNDKSTAEDRADKGKTAGPASAIAPDSGTTLLTKPASGEHRQTSPLPAHGSQQAAGDDREKNRFSIKSELLSAEILLINITIEGAIDQANTGEVLRLFNTLFRDGTFNVLIDMTGVTSIGSTGWGILVKQLKKAKDDRRIIVLAGMDPEIEEQFQLLALDSIFESYPDVDAALTDLHSRLHATSPDTEPPVMPPPETESVSASPLAGKTDAALPPEVQPLQNQSSDTPPQQQTEYDTLQRPAQTVPEKNVDKQSLPIQDKIKMIILENPLCEEKDLRRRLASKEYGECSIGRMKLRSILKTMNLETSAKRYQYFKMM
ncbi:MAG: FHA domain-containing protein [Chitinivibrionales bacterium]|nr:FHA domain-containing protein [Chitinivibrionales bacterium]